MKLDEAKKRIYAYLKSEKTWPILVDTQTKQDLADLIDYFQVGDNHFPSIERFCDIDGTLKIEELYDAVSQNEGNTFITELTGFLLLYGTRKAKQVLKSLATSSVTGHVVVFTYQCKDYLNFADSRIKESGRIIIVDGTPDVVPDIYFIAPALSAVFPESYRGMQKLGYAVETCRKESAYIVTDVPKSYFEEPAYKITQLDNGYDILRERDYRTNKVPAEFGNAAQWNYALQLMGSSGNWDSIIQAQFGIGQDLLQALKSYALFSQEKKWLYYIALVISDAGGNEYLRMAVDAASQPDELIKSIFRTILTVSNAGEKYNALYRQRKILIQYLKDDLASFTDFCKVLTIKGEDRIYYLTDVSQPERECVISWLDLYGKNYDSEQLSSIFRTVYPDLASYLAKYRFKNELLDSYFETYKYQKLTNHVLPSFEAIVDEQVAKMDFVSLLKLRSTIVDGLDVDDSRAFFVDALGVEYLGFIREKCNTYGLSANIMCARCVLPSITSMNKDFVETLRAKGCPIVDVKELDEIKHHGEDNFDYQKEKMPIYLIRELEILDTLLQKIRAAIFSGYYGKAIILSDHGASRLAVLHDTENIWSMKTAGEHSGRCCRINEIDSKPEFAIEENDFWVLPNYDRFKGGRKANVEVHGGASLEEVTVPIIEITQKQANVEAFITDGSKILTLGAGEHAAIRIYASVNSNDISIKLGGKYYEAVQTAEKRIYAVDLPDYTKKGVYTFEIQNGNDEIAIGQQFEIKRKGISENNLFG